MPNTAQQYTRNPPLNESDLLHEPSISCKPGWPTRKTPA